MDCKKIYGKAVAGVNKMGKAGKNWCDLFRNQDKK